MINAAIIGASGYGGGVLLQWLSRHPEVTIAVATSRTYAEKPFCEAFPGMAKRLDKVFAGDIKLEEIKGCDVVFLARDNGVAMNLGPQYLEAGCKVIDLSADFRFRDPATYEAWYPITHKSPEASRDAVYGMPELHKSAIRKANLVGNPGCYTTTSILGLAPLLALRTEQAEVTGFEAQPVIDPNSIIINGLSGVSGAGRSKFGLDFHFSEANESATAYKIAGTHRHTPEIEQELGGLIGQEIVVSFTPHLVPMTRGILATCYARLNENIGADELRERYRVFYKNEPFVYITDGIPATKHVLGSNMCHIGLAVDARTNVVTVVSCTDNLGKGMVGQAMQNMNLMFGLEETAGLEMTGVWP